MKIRKHCVLFCAGGAAYYGLELLYRGRSHGSMFAAGGLCFLLIGHLNRVEPRLRLPLRAVAGAMIVTMVELGVGMAVNRQYQVWDYRSLPGNFMGQICPLYSALWVPLSLVAAVVYDRLDRLLGEPEEG